MVYHSLEDHEQLLADKGYLEDHFKASYKMGYWLRELREQYDQARYQAAESGKTEQFTVTAYGNFNDTLETIKFEFKYVYNPQKDILALKRVQASMGTASKPHFLHRSGDLPHASKIFQSLSKHAVINMQYDLYNTLQRKFQREKDPLNDYDPTDDKKFKPYRKPYHKMRLSK